MISYISIAGTLGVGKTTMVKIIAEEFGFVPIYENFSANPFLAKFYKDMKRWAFHSQMFFLVEKIKQLEKIANLIKKNPVVQDTPIYEDVFSYAKAQKKLNNMSSEEWELYFKTYRTFDGALMRPDVIIYLDSPVEIIYERISQRDRRYEVATKRKQFLSYLRTLDRLNRDWVRKLSKKIKIVTIDTNGFDYVKDIKEKDKLLRMIRRSIE